jgi:hypothetical protein
MKEDFIIDALENIDDDMLADVDRLRERQSAKPRRLWMRYISVAACACFILGGAFVISRYEAPNRVGTEETTDPTDMSGQDFVHNYVSAKVSISYSGSTPRVITEPKEVTALFNVLKMIENTEEAESSVTKHNDNHGSESERIYGAAPGTVGGATYTIVLTSSDGEEVRYRLSGSVLISESTDKSYRLSREHYSALAGLINLK